MKIPKFNIGDKVYYNTPDSDQGIVIDISYSYANDSHKYLIGLSFIKSEWCNEVELTDTKIY